MSSPAPIAFTVITNSLPNPKARAQQSAQDFPPAFLDQLAAYWFHRFRHADGRCVICGNAGYADTDQVIPCFCPNGQRNWEAGGLL